MAEGSGAATVLGDADLAAFEVLDVADSVVGDVRDPYPKLKASREKGRVHAIHFPVPGEEGTPIFGVYGYDEVSEVLRDGKRFSSTVYEGIMGVVMGHTILEMDGIEHHHHRALIAQAFRPKALEHWDELLIRPLVDELIDRFVERGSADLQREFAQPFPISVIARIMGVPREDYPQFLRWSLELISVATNWERGIAASTNIREYLTPILAARRAAPADDLISELVKAEVDGHRLSDEEILPFLLLLLPAGAETTMRSLGNLLFALLRERERWEAVVADRSLLPAAIEEALRWEPPLTLIVRVAAEDTTLGGVDIPAGAQLVVSLAAANRDDQRWDDPDLFEHERESQHHVAFGHGAHVCLGQHLARMEMTRAVERLMDRVPSLRLAEGDLDPHVHGLTFRSPTCLPVTF